MENYEIKYLDCSKVENRIKLVKEVNRVIKHKEKPSKEELKRICKSLQKKYDMKMKSFRQSENYIHVSIEVFPGTYSTLVCNSFYELMCKYILIVKNYVDYKRLIKK